MSKFRQAGLTLVELLIGVVVGFIVVSGAISVYASTVTSSSELLKSSKLHQETSALLHVMANDLRRAGYWGAINTRNIDQNPFSRTDATMLVVRDDMAGDALQPARGQGSCVTYAYDSTNLPGNTAGLLEDTDLYGFRLNGTVVQMRQSGSIDATDCIGGTCTSCNNGVWQNVTDPDLIEITNLTFDLSESQCLNGSEPDGIDDNGSGIVDDAAEMDCYLNPPTVGSGDTTVETREILITVAGRLANDPLTQTQLSQTVRVRNDKLREW